MGYRSILISFLLTVVPIPLLVLTHHDTSSPLNESFAYLFIFLFLMSWCLIYPKLIVVWRVEKVLVSLLLQKQSRQVNINSKYSNTSVCSIRSKRMHTMLFDIPVLRSNTLPHCYSLIPIIPIQRLNMFTAIGTTFRIKKRKRCQTANVQLLITTTQTTFLLMYL